jgi:isoleucyl-tRNA synthetase
MKTIKPNFKELGPKYGKSMKLVTLVIEIMSQDEIKKLEEEGKLKVMIGSQACELSLSEVKITNS